jgi:hypothetical protein
MNDLVLSQWIVTVKFFHVITQPTGEVCSGGALNQHSPSYQLWWYLQIRDHLVKEAIKIRLHPDNFNRDKGFKLSHTSCPIIKMLQGSGGAQWARTDRGRNLTLPTSPQLRYIYDMCPHRHIRSLTTMMMTEMVLKTSVQYRDLMWLMAQEDFIEFSCCESWRTYVSWPCW